MLNVSILTQVLCKKKDFTGKFLLVFTKMGCFEIFRLPFLVSVSCDAYREQTPGFSRGAAPELSEVRTPKCKDQLCRGALVPCL